MESCLLNDRDQLKGAKPDLAKSSVPFDRSPVSHWKRLLSLAAGLSAVFGGSLLALTFVHHRGVNLSGDEPSYVGEAFSLARLHTWNLGSAFASQKFDRLVENSTPIEQFVRSHGIQFPYHSIGFSAILAPSLAFLESLGAIHLELLALLSVLVIWLSFELTTLTRAPRTWLVLIVVIFLAPGYLIATTQIYPDLLSGLVLAIVVVRLMIIENNGAMNIRSSAIMGILLFIFVWLDDKNIVIGVLVGAVAVLVSRRRGATRRDMTVLIGFVSAGAIGVAILNIYAYGHPLGPLQDIAPFSGAGLTKLVALIFDRRHGILVQSPATVLALIGAIRWWRKTPWSISVGVAAAAVVLVGNASLVTGMAGGSFVGRYEWEALPLALLFGGLFLIELFAKHRNAGAGVIGILFVLALLEWWALFTSRSDSQSFISNGWDPASYLGWWGRLDPSPILNYVNSEWESPIFSYVHNEWTNARNLWGLGALVALTLTVGLILVRLVDGNKRLTRFSMTTLFIAVSCWVMALASPFMLPTPLQYAASDLGATPLPVPSGAITVVGSGHSGVLLAGPKLEVLPGRYRVTVKYSLIDHSKHSAIFGVHEQSSVDEISTTNQEFLPISHKVTQRSLDLQVAAAGALSVSLTWHGSGRISVSTVTFSKIASCHVVECQGGVF